MALGILASVSAVIPLEGYRFRIFLPGFSRGQQFANYIVHGHGLGVAVVVGDDLPGRKHEVIADGRMGVRVISLGHRIAGCQTIQIRHRRVADDVAIAVVLFHHNEYVIDLQARNLNGLSG